MDLKGRNLNCTIPKAMKRWLAWIMAVAMIFSGIPVNYFGGVDQALADNIKENSTIVSGPAVYTSQRVNDVIEMPIGNSESYNFKDEKKVFGEDTVTADTEIFSSGTYIKLVSTNVLEASTNTHGLYMQGITTFTVKIPGEAIGVFTIDRCQYANCSAFMKVNGEQQGEKVSMVGSTDGNDLYNFEYKNTTSETVEMTIEFPITSNGYIHGISYEVTEIPEEATVSGNIGTEVAGEELLFKKGSSTVQSVVIDAEGKYSVVLPIGDSYTVEFKNSDVYEVTSGNTIDMTSTVAGATLTNNITYSKWDSNKSFSLTIGDTAFTVTPGSSKKADFTVAVTSGSGSVELMTSGAAIVWANLGGAGKGTLSEDKISVTGDNITTTFSGNVITVAYTDETTNPTSYSLIVKDNSASGIPSADGIPTVYNFKDGSIISELYKGNYKISGGSAVKSTDGLLTLTGKNGIYYNGSHGIAIGNTDTISVKVAGDATIAFELCEYTNSKKTGSMLSVSGMASDSSITPTSVDAKAEKSDGDTGSFEYTGGATTLVFTYTGEGTGYIHSVSVTNKKEVNGTLIAAIVSYDAAECASLTAVYDNVISDLEVTPTKIIFDEEPVLEKLSITADTTDKMGDGYQVSVDKTNHVIKVSHSNINAGNTVIASIPYTVFAVAPIGASESYDFYGEKAVFGSNPLEANITVISANGYIKLVSEGKLEVITDNNHGLHMQGATTFTMKIPANAMGVFTVNKCVFASCSAKMLIDGVQQGADVDLIGSKDNKDGTETVSLRYKNLSNKTVEMTIKVPTTNGYLHGISYSVTEIPKEATVSGTVGSNVATQNLLFKNGNSIIGTAEIDANGKYRVELPIGSSYTVEFEKSDLYEVVSGNTIDMTSTVAGATLTNNITYSKWDSNKSFSLTIGDTAFTVTPGSSKKADFTATATSGSGSAELVTADTAIVWANLGGAGKGTLSADKISVTGDNITTTFSGNVITVTYTDKTTNPTSYSLIVKDNSASGVPSANGTPIVYNFKDGSVVSELYKDNYKISGGSSVKSTDGLLTLTGENGIYYNGGHGIAISNTDTISVKVAGDATISFELCQYAAADGKLTISGMAADGSVSQQSIDAKVETDGAAKTFEYTGKETTLMFTYSGGTGYIHSMSVTNKTQASDVKVPQEKMPEIKTYGTKDNLSAMPVGQRLILEQTNGNLQTTNAKIDSSVSYFGFEPTTEAYKLEADVVLSVCGSSSANGIFFGAFDENYIATIAIRNKTGLRGILSKKADDLAGASSVDTSIAEGQKVHFKAERTKDGFVITATPEGESANTMTFKYNDSGTLLFKDNGINTSISYGFIVANATAIVTNMKYYNAAGEVVYDQNACYEAVGTAPIVSKVSAEPAKTRDYIVVSWESNVLADGDGRYVVEVKDGNQWKVIAETTDTSCIYAISGEGDYTFRVCGKLGVDGEKNAYKESEQIHVTAALPSPVITISSAADAISLSWPAVTEAVRYEIYRYSYDEGAENVPVFQTVTETSYQDTSVDPEMPYYYYVVAYSKDNYSNPSATVWAVPTAGHTGDYVYEDEATEIFITKKSYDTVFTDQVVLEGKILGTGTITAYVNDKAADSKTVSTGETFHFELTVTEGRNDVTLIFTDEDGDKTRQTYNFVYLTNYDVVVDAAYTGTDGEAVNGIPTYKTVQAAVDAAPAGNSTENTVILILAGDYEEKNRLIVNKPYLSIIGENRESTRIHCYPGNLGVDYEAGKDMSLRCATYIQSGATGFSAENISFENDYDYSTPDGKSNKSADALRCDADEASFINVKFTSIQDTLYMGQGHQYYNKCRIEGVVDFIYSGDDARAFFEDCEVVFLYESTKTSGYVCAPKTAANAIYGLTFYRCVVIGEEGCSGTGYLLARPWGPDAYITWIDCYMGKSIYKTEPYGDMSGNSYTKARFYEYGTYGPAFAINSTRRQISPNAAKEMVSNRFLEWEPDTTISKISDCYVGSVTTKRDPQYVTSDYTTDSYLQTDGDDTGLRAYNLEGYASAYEVSGGGLLKESSDNYYQVANAEEFLNALISAKSSGKKSVIELTADVNLGCYEVKNFDSYSSIIKEYKAQALTHPTLIESGVSVLTLTDMYNLTIFSSNGSSIKHANITMKNSGNIMIRNIKFDELWEWDDNLNNDSNSDDDGSEGNYDRNDWDYMTIDQGCDGIWIDHCTFYKAYDGVIDVKNPAPEENVTISWCEFLPGSEEDEFFNIMMNELSKNSSKYPYYQHLRESMSEEQIYMYAYGQKKTHLFGQGDDATNAVGIRVTLANNYYKDSMDRMPRLRYGNSHVYNCIMDAQDLLDAKNEIEQTAGSEFAKKIVSNGASSTCGAQVLLENCYMNGIINALNSGNGSSPSGYINAVNSVYYMDEVKTKLEPKSNSTADNRVLITDAEEFIGNLPYSEYILYNAEKLEKLVQPYAGAGKLKLTTLQWEKVSYNDSIMPDTGDTDEPGTIPPDESESTPGEPETTPPDESESTPGEPETTLPDEPESTPNEPETNRPSHSDDSDDDDDDDRERETTLLTSREENVVKNVLGTTSVKEVIENRDGKLVVARNKEVVFIEKNGTLSMNKWQQVEGAWYYFGKDSKAVGGWLQQGDKWYYLDKDDKKMETGWLKTEDGKWYLLDVVNGDMKTGWQQTADGKWYLLDRINGDMKTGWQQTADGKWYLLDRINGDMKTGWQQTADGKWYLLDRINGDMKTGWQQTADGKWYLLDVVNGDMKTGWQQTADGKWYLLDVVNGDMKIGWQMVKGIWYYLTKTGAMAEDTITPDGYKVGKDGAWTGESVR